MQKKKEKWQFINRFFIAPGYSFFLFGPRGTGKSTGIRQRYPNAVFIDRPAPEVFRSYSVRPERLREREAGADGQIIYPWYGHGGKVTLNRFLLLLE